MNSSIFTIGTNGHLYMDGCDTVKLAHEYGTPVYVMSERAVRQNCRIYKKAIDRFYGGKGLICYASKALCIKEMIRLVKDEGLGVDVVSSGELYTALAAGMPPDKICMHGNNKTEEEIKRAISAGIGHIVVDNIFELEAINRLSAEENKSVKILFRVKPGIDAHTHDFVRTGQIDSKFGVALETGEAEAFAIAAAGMKNIVLTGIHCHIGSQIFELEPFREAARVMVDFMGEMKEKHGIVMSELNLGGGFGVKYTEEDDPIEFDRYIEAVSHVVKETAEKWGMDTPYIMMEPGRSICGDAGITLYTIGGVKEIPNIRTYVSVDGGMGDNPRYLIYQAKYEFLIANRAAEEKIETVTVAGKCCESGDLLAEHIKLQSAEVGDVLAVFTTGAYNYSMASNYNRIPRPPVVFIKDGKTRIAVHRESFEDLIRNDV